MGQVADTRRRGADSPTVRVLLGLGFVLAVAASLFVVLADEVRWLRLAVLFGLWAALLAAFAMARYRREARAAELRQEEMTRIYELELHREIAARREYEVQLAETTRAELESRHDTELGALREQVERLTSVLSGFLDGDVLVERLTLSAEATRIRSVGDAGSAQAIGSMTRQLVEGTFGPAGSMGTGTAWGPQPPPLHGPMPAVEAPSIAGPSGGIPLDASAGAVTEQLPRIVESVAPTPVIDAVPAAPRVVGDPHREVADTPEGSDEANDAPEGQPAKADLPPADELPADDADEAQDLVEIEHGATEPEPDPELELDGEARDDAASGEVREFGPGSDESTGSAEPEFPSATDVPDAPTRVDSPATAWTLRHRLDTPAAPPIERTTVSRRAARAAAAVPEVQPSEAVAEITGGSKEAAGHSSGVSVAELLAAYGSSVPPRRRRRSDDT